MENEAKQPISDDFPRSSTISIDITAAQSRRVYAFPLTAQSVSYLTCQSLLSIKDLHPEVQSIADMPFNTALTRKLGIRGVCDVTAQTNERPLTFCSPRRPRWHAMGRVRRNGLRRLQRRRARDHHCPHATLSRRPSKGNPTMQEHDEEPVRRELDAPALNGATGLRCLRAGRDR